jgi:uncharacterized protein (TIGR02996 family)
MTAALLAQIWKKPTDRDLLRVYADWLASNGEPARAEFMQLSLLDALTPAQAKRRGALLAKHRGAWLGAARPFVYTWEESDVSPGFIARAQCSFAKLTAGFAHVRALGPRLIVNATEPKAKRETIALAKLPLGTLYGLGLYENDKQWITDELLVTLAPALDGLRALELHSREMSSSDHGWSAMLPHLRTVEHLDLTLGENPDRWVELLLDAKLKLKSLALPGWLDAPLRARVARKHPRVTFRDERRWRFNRATGFYE